MNITLYNYIGLYNKFNKTSILSTATSITKNCILKDGSSVLYPYITLTDDSDVLSLSQVNYAYIPSFNRYYFVEVESITNKLFTLRLSVDVLNTYVGSLNNSTLVLEREYGSGDYYEGINDEYNEFTNKDRISISQVINDETTLYKNWDISNVSRDTPVQNEINVNSKHNVNIVANVVNSKMRGQTGSIISPISCLPSVNKETISEEVGNYRYLFSQAKMQVFTGRYYVASEFSYVKNIIIYPFEIPYAVNGDNTPDLRQIQLGSTDLDMSTYIPTNTSYNLGYMITNEFTINLGADYKKFEPYSKYQMYFAFVGWVDVSASDIHNCKCISVYQLNLSTGEGMFYLVNTTRNYIILQQECRMGILVGMTRDNQQAINDAKISNAISTAIGMLGSIASVGLGVVASNPTAIVGGIISGTKTIGSAVTTEMSLHSQAQSKGLTSYSAIFSSQNVYLKRTYKAPLYSSSEFNDVIGRKTGTIDELRNIYETNPDNTFIKCKDLKLSPINATKQEQEMIFNLLKSGVYL